MDQKKENNIVFQFELKDEHLDVIANKTAEILESRNIEKADNDPIPLNLRKSLYSTDEVAHIVSLSRNTIVSHIKAKILIADQPGRAYRITHENLLKYLLKNG